MGNMKVAMRHGLELWVDLNLQRTWDAKLMQPWPFAPVAWVQADLVDDDNYRRENFLFGAFCSSYVTIHLQQLRLRGGKNLRGGTIIGFGVGVANEAELSFVTSVNQMNLNFLGYDVSEVAVRHGREFLNNLQQGKTSSVSSQLNAIHHAEIEQLCREDTFLPAENICIYAARFIQFLSREKMQQVMYHLGKFLRRTGRAVILVHPLPEKNPKVTWTNSSAYSLKELLEPTSEGLGGSVDALRQLDCLYYNQIYTGLTLQAR